ncbi:MAG: ERCC4 domain-containing protein [Candidatus Helarchaeota archaeon]
MKNPPIFDTREEASGLFSYLDSKGLDYKVEQLEIGDCIVSERCCIEIKRIDKNYNDLKDSLFDGRLYAQSQQRRDNYELSIMIIEINDRSGMIDHKFTKRHWESVEFSLEIDFNTHVYHTYSMKETVRLIYKLYKRLQKGKRYVTPINKKKIPLTLREKRIRFISGLLDVGEKHGTMLIDVFKTPARVIKWISLDGAILKLKGFDKKFFEKNKELIGEL